MTAEQEEGAKEGRAQQLEQKHEDERPKEPQHAFITTTTTATGASSPPPIRSHRSSPSLPPAPPHLRSHPSLTDILLGPNISRHFDDLMNRPSLGRIASAWQAPAPFPDEGLVPPTPRLDVQSPEAKAVCFPGTRWHELLLVAACMIGIGNVFARTVINASSVELMADFGMSKQMYGVIQGLPSAPAIFASPIGGALVDAIGADRCCVIFTLVMLLSSLLASLAVAIDSVPVLIMSQLCQGAGKAVQLSAQLCFIRLAANPARMGVYFALCSSMSRLASFSAYVFSPRISAASPYGYKAAIWTASGISAASFLCSLPLLGKLTHMPPLVPHLRRLLDRLRRRRRADPQVELEAIEAAEPLYPCAEGEEENNLSSGEGSGSGSGDVVDDAVEADAQQEDDRGSRRCMPSFGTNGASDGLAGLRRSCVEMTTLPYLLLSAALCCFYTVLIAIEIFAVDLLATTLHLSPRKASTGVSVVEVGSLVLGPILGGLVDRELWKRGRPNAWIRHLWPPGSTMVWSMVLMVSGLLILLASPESWLVAFCFISLAFAMAAASLWVTFPVFVPAESLGLGLGVVQALLDIAILVMNVVIGKMLDAGLGYRGGVLPLLIATASLALAASLLLVPRLRGAVEVWSMRRLGRSSRRAGAGPSWGRAAAAARATGGGSGGGGVEEERGGPAAVRAEG